MKRIILFLCISSSAWAKNVSEPMTVVKMNWSANKKMYRLTMLKHAAVYWAPKKFEACLLQSMSSQTDVKLSFETKNLQLSDCKKIAPSSK